MSIKILNRWTNACIWEGEAETIKDAVAKAIASRANLRGCDLRGCDLSESDLRGCDLSGCNLRGCNLRGIGKIKAIRVMTGLYRYVIFAIVAEDGEPWVRMGCQWRSVTEWDRITIRDSRTREFPNDGSTRSEQRARAFEFARGEAIEMAKEFSK